MNGLVIFVLLAIAPHRAVSADTSIYIENVIWPHASQNAAQPAKPAKPVTELIPGLQSNSPRRRPFPTAHR